MSLIRRDLHNQALNLLLFPLACMVVFIHVFSGSSLTAQCNDSDFPFVRFMILFARSFFSGQCVPIYFFIAGFVFFQGMNLSMHSYDRKMNDRFKSLFIPYLAWNTLGMLLILISNISIFSGPYVLSGVIPDIHISNIINMYWNGAEGIAYHIGDSVFCSVSQNMNTYPVDSPLWFVRDLMIVSVSAPVLNILLKRFGIWFSVVAGILWLSLPQAGLGHAYQLITAYFFFSSGAYMSFDNRCLLADLKWIRVFSFVLYPVIASGLLIYSYTDYCDAKMIIECGYGFGPACYFKQLAVLAGLPFAYNIAVMIVDRWKIKALSTLAAASFFIYAGHMLFVSLVETLLSMIIKPVTDLEIIVILTLSVLLLIFCLLDIFIVMRKYIPKLLSLFTGGCF